ncbi:MAG: hypothetical protein ABJ275_00190 [Maricaulaceae bacterium]
MKIYKFIFGGALLAILNACASATPVVVNTNLTESLPKEAAISYLKKQGTLFGISKYGHCVFDHGDIRIAINEGWNDKWEWINTYAYNGMTLYVSDNPVTGREYTLKGDDIIILKTRSTYSRGKQCSITRSHSKDSSKYTELTDEGRAAKIVSALQSLGVNYKTD